MYTDMRKSLCVLYRRWLPDSWHGACRQAPDQPEGKGENMPPASNHMRPVRIIHPCMPVWGLWQPAYRYMRAAVVRRFAVRIGAARRACTSQRRVQPHASKEHSGFSEKQGKENIQPSGVNNEFDSLILKTWQASLAAMPASLPRKRGSRPSCQIVQMRRYSRRCSKRSGMQSRP